MNDANLELVNFLQQNPLLYVELDEENKVLNYISIAAEGYVPARMPEDEDFFRKENGAYCHVFYKAEEKEDGIYDIIFNTDYKLLPQGMAVYEFDEKGKPVSYSTPWAVRSMEAVYPIINDLGLYILVNGELVLDTVEQRFREINNLLSDYRAFLNSTDYKVLRRVREKELKISPETMSDEEYIQLEEARQQRVEEINRLEMELTTLA